jgi:AcrR family transcriptional regulator
MGRSLADTGTRDRILAAAMDVFADKGYHGAVVDDIVIASGTSKGAFYHYFPSKQGIFLTLIDELSSLVETGVEAAIAETEGALAKVEAALRVVFETAAARRDLVKILLVEAVGLGPTLEQKRLEVHRRFAALIQQHLDRAVVEGSIPRQDTAVAAGAWIGALNEIITQWLLDDQSHIADDGLERGLGDRLPALRSLLLRSVGAEVREAHPDPGRSR